jgi:hypothetical protein
MQTANDGSQQEVLTKTELVTADDIKNYKPVDCQLGEWSPWSSCNKSCGGGTQISTRQVVTAAANGGK